MFRSLFSPQKLISDHSVNSITKTSVYQLQKTDIRVNAICPGLIETNMTKEVFDFARQRGKESKIGQLNPMGRFGVAQGIVPRALTMRAFANHILQK
jgi:NAD(P)-dependent dehydrogenase (short-subunit alcohol dehydrogenase family)